MLLNIIQDQEEEDKKYEYLLRFINPKAAKAVFDDSEVVQIDDADFLAEVNAHTSEPITSADLRNATDETQPRDLDVIEEIK